MAGVKNSLRDPLVNADVNLWEVSTFGAAVKYKIKKILRFCLILIGLRKIIKIAFL